MMKFNMWVGDDVVYFSLTSEFLIPRTPSFQDTLIVFKTAVIRLLDKTRFHKHYEIYAEK